MNAKRIVENLLSFVRYREHSEEVVDINKIINEVLTVKRNMLTLNNIVIQRKLATGLPELTGNPGELQQAFFNIVNNAIAAMEEGGTLTVETTSRESKRSIEVIISDTGTGIKPKDRTRIFDPLFTTKKVGEGTGLGLTVTYAIIKKYGGEIAFETRTKEESRDSGTTFIITLPTLPA
jgi:signal transduction histidine kinase